MVPEQCDRLIDELVSYRKEKEITQLRLAREAGLTQSVIARIESKKSLPRLDTIMKIVDVLGYDLKIVPKHRKTRS